MRLTFTFVFSCVCCRWSFLWWIYLIGQENQKCKSLFLVHSKDDEPKDETVKSATSRVQRSIPITFVLGNVKISLNKILRKKTVKDVILPLGFCVLPWDHEIQVKIVRFTAKPQDLAGLQPTSPIPSQDTLEQLKLSKLLCFVA